MNLEQQVCSLELAKRLKEIGIKQESLVYWLNIPHCTHLKVKDDGFTPVEDENGNPIVDKIDYRIELGNPYAWNIDKDNCWSAFTSSELGQLLPAIIPADTASKQDLKMDSCKDTDGRWMVAYFYDFNFPPKYVFISGTEANARATMLIYLIENKLMELT